MFQKRTTTTLPASTEASSGRDGSPGAASSARPGFAGLGGRRGGLGAGAAARSDRRGGFAALAGLAAGVVVAPGFARARGRRLGGGGGRRAADGLGRGLAARGGGVRGVDGLVRLGHVVRQAGHAGRRGGGLAVGGRLPGRSTGTMQHGEERRDDEDDAKGKTDLVHAHLSAAKADS